MRLPKFEYFEPEDLKAAVAILQKEPAAKILAGGTDLLVNMKHRVECPPVLVNIKRIADLDYVRQDNGDIRIGALTPLKRLHAEFTPCINYWNRRGLRLSLQPLRRCCKRLFPSKKSSIMLNC